MFCKDMFYHNYDNNYYNGHYSRSATGTFYDHGFLFTNNILLLWHLKSIWNGHAWKFIKVLCFYSILVINIDITLNSLYGISNLTDFADDNFHFRVL